MVSEEEEMEEAYDSLGAYCHRTYKHLDLETAPFHTPRS